MNNLIKREEEIDLKELFQIIFSHKWLILFFILIFTAGSVVLVYFATPMYKSDVTIEISTNNNQQNANNIIAQALNISSTNSINTEMQIIKSRFMVLKALKKVNFTKRYYVIKNFKTTEIYAPSAPFKVLITKGKGITFTIKPISQNSFELIAKNKFNNKIFDSTETFGKIIKTPYFKIKIIKVKPLDLKAKYKFIWLDKIRVANSLVSALNVSLAAPKASIIKISFSDNIPKRDADFLNALANAYIKQSVEQKTKQANQTLKFIDSQLKIISKKLAESELALENFKSKNKIVDLSLEAQNLVTKLSQLQSELTQLNLQENAIDFILNKINSTNGKYITVGIVQDTVLPQLITQLQTLILKKENLLLQYTPKYPGVIEISNQIRTIKNMIKSRILSIKEGIEQQKKYLSNLINKYEEMLQSLPKAERKYIDLKRQYLVNEKIYSFLLEKRSATAVAKAGIIANNRIIDDALVPLKPYKPNKKMIIIIGIILGLIVGIIIAILIEFLNTKISSVEDIEKLTDVPVIGVIPHFKNTKNILKVFSSPKSAVTEAFRVIRTNIRFLSHKETEVITVTSTVASEGKTTVSSNLAGIYAMSGKKTVIINLDMRKPALHKVFEIENDSGISNVLAGEKEIQEVIHPTKYENLFVIPSGPVPPNPGELIQKEKMDEIVDYLKKDFEIVIFDTPPVGLVVDAVSVLLDSDVNIYIFRAGYSKKEFIKTLNDLKYNKKVRGLGIILNDVKTKKGAFYGGYGYGGYGYYTEDE